MIKLKIKNYLEKKQVIDGDCIHLPVSDCDREIYELICDVKLYDTEKWKDNRIYEFGTLKEVVEFIKTCDIEFTDESEESFGYCDWYSLHKSHYIDSSEDSLIVFEIRVYRESRD